MYEKTGYKMSAPSISALINESPKQMKMTTLDALCTTLNCKPDELLVHTPTLLVSKTTVQNEGTNEGKLLTELIGSCLLYKMGYTSCPNCSNRVSENTIKLSGVCNNCYCHRTLQRYKDDYEFLKSRLKDPSYASHVLNVINFVSKSKFSNVIKYRTVVNFIKVLNQINDLKLIKEHLIEKIYFEKCAVKSPKILEIIKIYFYSLDLIKFDEVSNPFPNIDIRHTSRYRADILDYF